MANENESDVELTSVEDEDTEEVELDLDEEADTPSQKKDKPKRTPEEQLAYLEGRTQRLRKKLGLVEPRGKKAEVKTGELGDSDLNYLDLKGVSEDDEVAIVQSFVQKTGQSVRQALKDEYVQTKLSSLRSKKEVEKATPSSTKRAGNQSSDLSAAKARFEQTGELPDDFELRAQVINNITEDQSSLPPWRRK